VSNVFYFSSDYGTEIALSTSLDGAILTDGITSTDTSLTVTLPLYYPYNTIFLKSLNTSEIGSSLSVPETTGTIYFDGDGNLRATNITTLTRGQESTFYFSSDYGTRVLLALIEDGDTFEEGVTSNLTTELVFTIPETYGKNIIYVKSPTISGIGSSLSITGSVTPNHVYFNAGGTLQVSGLTTLTRGQEYTLYFSSDYGTSVALSTSLNGPNFTDGITSTDTELTVTLPLYYPYSTIFLKSLDTPNIGSEISVNGLLESKLYAGDPAANDFFGISVSISDDGLTAIVGANGDDGVSDNFGDSGSAYIFKYANGLWTETKLYAGDAAANDFFGISVSISGDGLTAIVGAYADNGVNDDLGSSGSAYIFKYANGSWTQTAKLYASDPAGGDFFGWSVSISDDGLTAIVGAYGDNGVNNILFSSGSAYIFKYTNGLWTETKLYARDPAQSDNFGRSVSISGDGLTAIVGADRDDGVNNYRGNSGSAYIFKYANGGWSQTAKLYAGDAAIVDFFGRSVSISGDGLTAIVGAYGDDGVNNNYLSSSGSAYIFKYANGGWSQTAKLYAGDPASADFFGWSVSISGDGLTAIVGAYGDNGVNNNLSSSGSAYIFKYANGGWSQTAKLLASDPAAGDNFGWSVSISGDGLTAIVGADGDDGVSDNFGDSGSAYVYKYF
jgi:hypothetical protein